MWFKKRIPPTGTPDSAGIFLDKKYQLHNIARLSHLDSLGLNLRKRRVIEIGAGVGDHTYYYLIKDCFVIATDGRPELVDFIKRRFGVNGFVLDVEKQLDEVLRMEKVDIIHCYGLLYHIQNPAEFIIALKGKCDLLLLETCVSHDFRDSGAHIISEDSTNPTQAISGLGCRPTRRWIATNLSESFPFVYLPRTQPNHPEFPTDWSEPMEDRSSLIRAVFIASANPLNENENLTDVIPERYSIPL